MYYVFNKEKKEVFYVQQKLYEKNYLKFSTKKDADNLISTLYNGYEFTPIEENQIIKAYVFSGFRNGEIIIEEILYCDLFGLPYTDGPAFKTENEAFEYGKQKELKSYLKSLQETQKTIDQLNNIEYNTKKATA